MPLKTDSKYPSRLAYVVKFQGNAAPHALTGRIENLVSGRQLEFRSGEELLDCFARDLLEHLDEPLVEITGIER